MKIARLTNETTKNILSVFNNSFSDYIVPFHLSSTQLEKKMKHENIDLDYSVGAYDGHKLVGFILHAVEYTKNGTYLYNAGTGVIPSHRGQKITKQMYSYCLPLFRMQKVDNILLEVITGNEHAIRAYKNIGFKKTRELECYKGDLIKNETKPLSIGRISKNIGLDKLKTIGEVTPTWQNSFETIARMKDSALILGLTIKEQLIGYLIANKSNHRIIQIAIDQKHRRNHYGNHLLQYYRENYTKSTSIINIDATSTGLRHFLLQCGLEQSIMQHEMKLIL